MSAGDFIASCRRLRDLDLAAGAQLSVSVAEEMPLHYAMPYPEEVRKTFRRGVGQPAATRRGQYHELVQHLIDLRYLPPAFFEQWHHRREDDRLPTPAQLRALQAAVERYYWEDRSYTVPILIPPPATGWQRQEWLEQHLSVLTYRLSLFTSFDGDLPLPLTYRIGERSVYGRSLAYRLRVLFRLENEALRGVYFGRAQLGYLHSIDNSLGGDLAPRLPLGSATSLDPSVWRLLASWEDLFTAFRRANRFADTDGEQGRVPYFLIYDVNEAPPTNGDAEDKRRKRLERRARRKVSRAVLHRDTGSNRLGVRLLQIALWRAGFYTGAVDGAFGRMSHAALERLIQQEQQTDKPVLSKGRLKKIILRIDDNTWVADLRLLSKILLAYAPADAAVTEVEETEILDAIAADQPNREWEEEVLLRQREVRDEYPDIRKNPLRRVYYGLRGLIRGAWRAVRKVVRWVARKVAAAAGAVFNFIKAVLKRVQEGIGLFYEGFRYFSHYVLGRPFMTLGVTGDGQRPFLSTRVSLDFDATNYATTGTTQTDIDKHREFLRFMRRGLDFFLDAITTIIRIVGLLSTPLGWVRIGVLIARTVRDLLRGDPPRIPV